MCENISLKNYPICGFVISDAKCGTGHQPKRFFFCKMIVSWFIFVNMMFIIFQDCYFACEYHGGYIALRDAKGLYLAPIGSRAVLKTRSNSVSKDELFSLEDSAPQASFVASSNTRYVSVKQGN